MGYRSWFLQELFEFDQSVTHAPVCLLVLLFFVPRLASLCDRMLIPSGGKMFTPSGKRRAGLGSAKLARMFVFLAKDNVSYTGL